MNDDAQFQESDELSSAVLPPLTVHNLSYIGATGPNNSGRSEAEDEEVGGGNLEGSPLVDPNTPTESMGGRYLIPDGTPGDDTWESDSLDK